MTHHRSYPSNPGLLPKLYINEWQKQMMDMHFKETTPIWEWLEAHNDVTYIPEPDIEESWKRINEVLREATLERLGTMAKFAPRARRSGKTWLGSQIERHIIDEHLRIPQVREVPSIRDLSWTYGPVSAHWENGTTTFDHGSAHWSPNEESDAVQLKEWLQLRSVCRRASSCGVA